MRIHRSRSFQLSALCSILLVLVSACSEKKAPPRPTPEFPVVSVIQRDQPINLEMVGETMGSSDIPIRARVDGFLESMDFIEGQNVEKGSLLYTIDDIPFQTKVVEAQGQLAEANTSLAQTESDLARIRPLAEMNAVSQMDLDEAIAKHEAAMGALQTANAQVKQAQIEKGYCRIYAPITGLVGLTEVKVGEYVGATNGLLNFVSQVNPIRVRFSIDEKSYLKFARKIIGAAEKGKDPRAEKKEGALTLILADGSIHDFKGHVVTNNAAIDPSTGTFTLEADFPNPSRLVLAGQYARIRTDIDVRKDALLVPQRSIVELQGQFSVFVVDAQGKIEQRKVMVGPKINKLQIISSGLKADEQVMLEGVQKVRNGMTIKARLTDFDEMPSSSADKPQKKV
ncbi:MAG: efflux RND transporter periplasmic adaptor subunit [Pseudomonadales bacterium]|nr:efflux RND transporter periplasmic adaptor subunit [Pseudomonadales bacterium]